MSGLLQLKDALGAHSERTVRRHKSVRRGNVTSVHPLTVELQDHDVPLVEGEDFHLAQWAELYRNAVGFSLGDMVLMHLEEHDWLLTDIVSDTTPRIGPAVVYDTDQIGVVKTWTGLVIPTNWMLADGRALNRASYAQLYAALGGASSPWGQGDGSTTFNIPDLRSRMLVGAGQGTGLSNRAMGAYSTSVNGEETHVLQTTEMPSHNHGGATGQTTTDHYHNFSVTSGNDTPDHGHTGYTDGPAWSTSQGYNVFSPQSAGYNFVAITYNAGFVGGDGNKWNDFNHTHNVTTYGASVRHQHPVSGNTPYQSYMRNSVDGNNADPNHSHTITSQGGGVAHNNMPPWCAVALIIKVTGTQIDPGGALVGATGQRGSTWFMYNGSGTPASGTFIGELDGDWAIRKSDGENFQRVNGQWVDQSFTNRSTATVTAARAHRAGALTMATGWAKVPLDTADFDTAGLLNLVNGRIVIQTAGLYHVDANVLVNVSGTGTYTVIAVAIQKNGVQVAQNYTDMAVATNASATISDTVQCVPGDYLELYAINSQGTTLWIGSPGPANYLAVKLLTAGAGPAGPPGPPGALGTPPAMSASSSQTQPAVALNVPTIVPLDTPHINQGGMTLSGGCIRVPARGLYQVNVSLMWNTDVPTGRVDACIMNYTQQGLIADISQGYGGQLGNKTAGAYLGQNFSGLVPANANDLISVQVMNRAGAGTLYCVNNWLTVSCAQVSN